MADQLKTFFSPSIVRRLAADIARVHPAFPSRAFIKQANAGLERLELLDRGRHISRALAEHLPEYPKAIAVLLRSLGPEHRTDELVGVGMAPFFYLPHTIFVAEQGLDHFDLSMQAQSELTKRFSAESSIRAFIAKDPERTLSVLHTWAREPNAHVRRLVSEGTRLRLPWANRVPWLDANPELEAGRRSSGARVRRVRRPSRVLQQEGARHEARGRGARWKGSNMSRTRALTALAGALSLVACRGAQPSSTTRADQPAASTAAQSGTPVSESPPATTKVPTESSPASGSTGQAFQFDADNAGQAPAGFSFGRTGSGAAGRWVVRAESDAPSKPNVLAQMDADDTDFRFPVAVSDAPPVRDLRLSVRCKMVSGRVDQACGLVFRHRDENNYFITRANALENNIRLYTVKDGKRRQLASWSGRVAAGVWHEYAVEARGDHLQVFWDGNNVLEHRDTTFPDAGRVGVWTKADSVTYFDDLTVAPLRGTP